MELIYFKSDKGNFGDDLNPWLWNKIFRKELNIKDGTYFFGIGSILHNNNKHLRELAYDTKKVVFGTGVRPAKDYSKFKVDETWDIRFLRGPLSSRALGNQYPYITDAAYAIRQLDDFESRFIKKEKKYEMSLMPYFHSVQYFDWKKVCADLGYHYISPYSEKGVEHTLDEIASSKQIITEAMHGAILADALRVPWHRFILSAPHHESPLVSEFKWSDWLLSVNIEDPEVTFIPFYIKGKPDKYLKSWTKNILSIEVLKKNAVLEALKERLNARELEFSMSSDRTVCDIDIKINRELEKLLSEYSSKF